MHCCGNPDAPRLFDLVKPADENLKAAFYYALRDTVVARNMDRAAEIAYAPGSHLKKVVTLKVRTGGCCACRFTIALSAMMFSVQMNEAADSLCLMLTFATAAYEDSIVHKAARAGIAVYGLMVIVGLHGAMSISGRAHQRVGHNDGRWRQTPARQDVPGIRTSSGRRSCRRQGGSCAGAGRRKAAEGELMHLTSNAVSGHVCLWCNSACEELEEACLFLMDSNCLQLCSISYSFSGTVGHHYTAGLLARKSIRPSRPMYIIWLTCHLAPHLECAGAGRGAVAGGGGGQGGARGHQGGGAAGDGRPQGGHGGRGAPRHRRRPHAAPGLPEGCRPGATGLT